MFKKYDIIDYLQESAHKLKDIDLFDLIVFHAFCPTNLIINEICEFFPTLSNTIENFKKALPATDFYTIKK